MLENTDKAVAGLLEKLPELLSSAQLPELAQQILEYGVFDAKLTIVVGVIFLLSCVPMVVMTSRVSRDDCFFGWLLAIAFPVVGLMFLTSGLSQAYKIEHAPKLYILEKAAYIIGRGK